VRLKKKRVLTFGQNCEPCRPSTSGQIESTARDQRVLGMYPIVCDEQVKRTPFGIVTMAQNVDAMNEGNHRLETDGVDSVPETSHDGINRCCPCKDFHLEPILSV